MPALKHNNNFHLLRHIAAFLVLYAHAVTALGKPEAIFKITNGRIELSSLGVEAFFVISGYLVMQSRLRTKGRKSFAIKRFLRLWPAMFVVTVILALVVGPFFSSLSAKNYYLNGQTWEFLLRNSIFLPEYRLPGVLNGDGINSPFWTLFFEACCYGILFLTGGQFLQRRKKTLAIAWLGIVVLRYFPFKFFDIPPFLAPFWYGINNMMFLFFSAAIYRLFDRRHLLPKRFYLAALAMLIISTLFPLPVSLAEVLQDASLLFFVVEWGKSAASFKWPGWDISYGTYLLAYPVEMIVANYLRPFHNAAFGIFIVTFIITVPLAFLSWFFVERPALRKKNSLDKKGEILAF